MIFIVKRAVAFVAAVLLTLGVGFAQNVSAELFIPDDTVSSGNKVRVPVILDGALEMCALQFAIHIPDGIMLAAESDNTSSVTRGELCSDHTLSYYLQDGVVYVACLSMTNSFFQENRGAVCYLTLQADSLFETETKLIRLTDVEICKSAVECVSLDEKCCSLTVCSSELIPQFSFNLGPFTFNGSFESSVTVTSNIDIRSIVFEIAVPEGLAENNLVRIFGQFLSSQFRTSVATLGVNSYEIAISGRNEETIIPGTTSIIGVAISVDKDMIVPGVYSFFLDNIVITTSDGTDYYFGPLEYKLNLIPTQIDTPHGMRDDVIYNRLDGITTQIHTHGITIMRNSDGVVTKFINR